VATPFQSIRRVSFGPSPSCVRFLRTFGFEVRAHCLFDLRKILLWDQTLVADKDATTIIKAPLVEQI
jgi:hypothetical protein